jgi:hypothetical protein
MRRIASTLALMAAVALCATVLAWWTWRWFAPAPVPDKSPPLAEPIEALRMSGLFAAAPGPSAAATIKPEPSVLAGDARLIGVFAQAGGQGYALFRLPGGAKLVGVAQEITAGATLVSVRPDGITIRDGGGERDIALRTARAAATTGAMPSAPASAVAAPNTANAARAAACAPPAGFRGVVVRLNAELLQGMIRQPDSWKALAVPERGALVIRDDSGFAAMLSMKKGDRVELANGIALTVPDDVVGAVLKPLAASQPVRLVGSRDGAAREWMVFNAGTCGPT